VERENDLEREKGYWGNWKIGAMKMIKTN